MNSATYHQNSKDTKFKSWGETQIARLLERNRIRYFYEHPLAVIDGGKTRIWYPDFQLPDYGILIEYFGRENDPDYESGMRKKKAVYQANSLAALLLTPVAFKGNWPAKILGQIEDLLAKRLDSFRRPHLSYRPRA